MSEPTPDKVDTGAKSESSREALLRAATTLFAKHGPAAVSTRQIAAEANVNSGLIHRHFTTKDALLREVLSHLAADIAATEHSGESNLATFLRFLDATRERAAYWKLLARCILDGESPDNMQSHFPTVARICALFEEMQAKGTLAQEFDPQALAAAFVAMALGWMVFEPWLVRAASLDDRPLEEARALMRRTGITLIGAASTT